MGDFSIASLTASQQSVAEAKSGQVIRALHDPSSGDSHEKIDKAAKDFESILIGTWLEKAEKSFATVPGDDPDQQSDAGHDQFQSIACQSLAEGLSKTGSFHIAEMISRQLTAAAEARQKAEKTQIETDTLLKTR